MPIGGIGGAGYAANNVYGTMMSSPTEAANTAQSAANSAVANIASGQAVAPTPATASISAGNVTPTLGQNLNIVV